MEPGDPGHPEPGEARGRRRLTARVRIFAWLVAILGLGLTAAFLLQRSLLLQRLENDVESDLAQEAAELRQLSEGRDPATGEPFEGDAAAIFRTFLRRNIPASDESYLTFVDGAPFQASADAPFPLDRNEELREEVATTPTPLEGRISTPAGPVRYRAQPVGSVDGEPAGVFLVASFLEPRTNRIERTVRIGAVVAAGVFVVGTGVAWVVAGRVLRPIRLISETARTITETDLSQRIDVRGSDDVAQLGSRFNTMLDRLEAAFSSQRAFLSDAGHELRTPITIVRGHLELLGDDPTERAETLDLVDDELDRMARLVDDLLLLARSQRPAFLQREVIDVSGLVRRVAATAEPLAPGRITVNGLAPVQWQADEDRLSQALLNLVSNAANHGGEEVTIKLGAKVSDGGDRLELWVADDGPGIPPQQRAHLFDRFWRGENRSRDSGSGLGLAIVAATAMAHGGHVDVTDVPSGGAMFTLVLPRARGVDEE